MYKKIFEFILYLIQKTVSSEPATLDYEKKWKYDKETLNVIDTGYGFNIDYWNPFVRGLDWILSWIPIYDEEPTIDPAEYAHTLEGLYAKYIPREAANTTCLTDFFLNDTGSFFVKDNVVDFSMLEAYEVREGFERYGGKVFIFNGKIDHYEYMGNRYDGDDARMDKIIRATLCLQLMVRYHALKVHLNSSQRGVYAFYGKYGKNHLLKDLLYLMTFEALEVNRRIPILVSPHGIVARLFALNTESFTRLLHDILQEPAFDREELLGYAGTVWNTELVKYAAIVDEFIDTFDISDEEKLNVANYFITATAAHDLVGDSQLRNMVVSSFFLSKVYKERPGFESKLDSDLLVSLLLSVSGRQPLCVDPCTDNVFDDITQRENWKKFRERLINEFPNEKSWFLPAYFEISVGF